MKRMSTGTMSALMLLGIFLASALVFAQSSPSSPSLGDVARQARKDKAKAETSHHYDNDNLPVNEDVSVVGPAPSAPAPSADPNSAQNTPTDSKTAQANHQTEIKQKMDEEKSKVDALAHELELDQREYRLRAATFYGDAGAQLRNSAQWSKDDAQYKSDMESKQKALTAAQQELSDLQEQARKAGVKEKESDSDKDKK